MATVSPRLRAGLLAFAVFSLFAVLGGRLLQLHWTAGRELQALASRQRVVVEDVSARPGEILDRKGNVLATSIEVRSVFLVPKKLANHDEVVERLSQILRIPLPTLKKNLEQHADKGFLWVKRRISDDEAEQVRDLKLPRDTWGFRREYRRFYPQGSCAAQVIGQRDIDGKGRGGIESRFDKELAGQAGRRRLLQDARGRVLQVLADDDEHEVIHGEEIQLTIDVFLQLQAERILGETCAEWKPKSACAVILDPHTGEILAMASRPTYDPEHAELAPPDGWTNRAINDQYEPGSTFKPIVVAWGIDQGVIQRDEVLNCENGEWRMGRRVLHDHHKYGDLSISEVLAKSSNIGMAKIGERLQNQRLYECARAFGFGKPTGIELPGEASGTLWPIRKWTSYSTGSIPMGQELTATPLQIANSLAVFANGGKLVTPRITKRRGGREQVGEPTGVATQVIRPETAHWLRTGPLVDVVSKGTGKKAAIPGYSVFGKTGTAQKVDPVTGEYSRSLHVSSFVCGAPAENPRAIVIVSVDEPSVTVNGEHFGGSVAAPPAGRLLQLTLDYLQVPYEQGEKVLPSPPISAIPTEWE